jgi:hypothetical protein
MNRGGLDLGDLEGFLPFRCPNLPTNLIPLPDLGSHE